MTRSGREDTSLLQKGATHHNCNSEPAVSMDEILKPEPCQRHDLSKCHARTSSSSVPPTRRPASSVGSVLFAAWCTGSGVPDAMIHFQQLFPAVLGFNFLNLLAMSLFVCSLMRSMYVQVMDDRPLLRFLQPLTLPHV